MPAIEAEGSGAAPERRPEIQVGASVAGTIADSSPSSTARARTAPPRVDHPSAAASSRSPATSIGADGSAESTGCLQQRHAQPELDALQRRHESRDAAADDHDVPFVSGRRKAAERVALTRVRHAHLPIHPPIRAVEPTVAGVTAECETGGMTLHITGDPDADRLLTEDPLALLIGMLLDQQVAMEVAFSGPLKIEQRVGSVDAATLAAYDPDGLVEAFRQTPSIHRYPGSMAGRVQSLCAALEQDWGGEAAALWTRPTLEQGEGAAATTGPDGAEVLRRLKKLPGFGEQKAKIFLALLGKQYGFTGDGWREASAPYGEEGSYRSVADIVSPESLAKVREHKRAMKAAAKTGGGGGV